MPTVHASQLKASACLTAVEQPDVGSWKPLRVSIDVWDLLSSCQ